jgi:hypothetical protein
MLSGTGYPSGENYPAGTGMELFFTRMRVRVTRRVKFYGCGYGYGYGWALPVGYVPVAISTQEGLGSLDFYAYQVGLWSIYTCVLDLRKYK